MLKTCWFRHIYKSFVEETNKDETSYSFELWFRHHEMVRNHHNEDENPKKIGKEAEVLVVKHL